MKSQLLQIEEGNHHLICNRLGVRRADMPQTRRGECVMYQSSVHHRPHGKFVVMEITVTDVRANDD